MSEITMASNLANIEVMGLKECFGAASRTFNKGEIITRGSSNDNTIGIISDGTAYLTTINSDDQRRILDYYQSGEIFGRHFWPQAEENLYYVIAKTKCTVTIINYSKLITCCDKSCNKHITAIDNMIMTLAHKTIMHIDILSQRTMRSKLMSLFEHLKNQKNSNTFTLPLPLSDLADYLAVDRSAMMRELKKLNAENIIKSEKRKITLL